MNLRIHNENLSTRDQILRNIKIMNEATVDKLANVVDVSPVTVRHHLNALQGEGLLKMRSVRRKVGRPYHVYSLSDDGHELFPQRYVRLNNRLLEEVKRQFSPEAAKGLLRGVVSQIIAEHQSAYDMLDSFEARLTFLTAVLNEEGFMAEWAEDGSSGYVITEHSCPYMSVGSHHDEVCVLDTELMVTVLQTEVTQHSCMLQGDSCCQFSVTPPIDQTARPTPH